MKKYNPQTIEKKWQEYWQVNNTFVARQNSQKDKKYILVEFPFPSGDGLHMGHLRSYTAADVLARYYRMNNYEVMYPLGWDAFGLPAENYAIKHGVQPAVSTAKNIANIKKQCQRIGYSFDWSREINTTDPNYYKWTQWLFLQFYKAGLAYEATGLINWCPKDKTGLANEEVINGKCERCGTVVEKKELRQWYLKITEYAEKLLQGLDELPDWPEAVKLQQRNWIGKSEGAEIDFEIVVTPMGDKRIGSEHNQTTETPVAITDNEEMFLTSDETTESPVATTGEQGSVPRTSNGAPSGISIKVFTTRPDTIFGATYLVLAPEHELLSSLDFDNKAEVQNYIEQAKSKEEQERLREDKEKTGIELQGVKAINPATNEEIPIWVADYVLGGYGTGAIMAVPAHDGRDFEFAKKFGLKITRVIQPNFNEVAAVDLDPGQPVPDLGGWSRAQKQKLQKIENLEIPYIGDGTLINSNEYDGLDNIQAGLDIKNKYGREAVQYKLRDWVFSRQRYWGEPIPLVHCEKDGVVPVPEDQLPVILPDVKNYEPTGTGESPLAAIEEWVNTTCPTCGGPAKRETNTMPQWAGSSWYYLRYTDPQNQAEFANQENLKYWLPVDVYFGGMEHTTLHLLYSRFWNIFLHDQGLVPVSEPYKKRVPHGIILASDNTKMSKSKGNVVNPDEIVKQYGADTTRMYELFLGPHGQMVAWNDSGISGVAKFLDRVWNWLTSASFSEQDNSKVQSALHRLIKSITDDIETYSYNTAVSNFMKFYNEVKNEDITSQSAIVFLQLLYPFAPHIAEELHEHLGGQDSLQYMPWPKYDATKLQSNKIKIAVQVNGKLRDTIEVDSDAAEQQVTQQALALSNVQTHLGGSEPKKVIYVPGKIVNIVV